MRYIAEISKFGYRGFSATVLEILEENSGLKIPNRYSEICQAPFCEELIEYGIIGNFY